MQHSQFAPGSLGSLLDIDGELTSGIPEEDRAHARRAFRGAFVAVPAGPYDPSASGGPLGFLIVSGALCREVSLIDRRSLELLGPGDILTPSDETSWPQLGGGTSVTAIKDTILFSFGPAFAAAAAQWPSVLARVFARIDDQRERLAVQGLIVHIPRAEHRLLLAMWHLSVHWGRVTAEGTVLPLHLSHALIGQLIATRRSTATLAIRRGEREGWLTRRADGTWLLHASAEERALALSQTCGAVSNGMTLMLRSQNSSAASRPRPVVLAGHAARPRLTLGDHRPMAGSANGGTRRAS